jgi:hypothetical protein
MQERHTMTNGDYNPYFQEEQLSNDPKIARWTMIGLAIASVVAVGLIIAAILSTRACSV